MVTSAEWHVSGAAVASSRASFQPLSRGGLPGRVEECLADSVAGLEMDNRDDRSLFMAGVSLHTLGNFTAALDMSVG